MNMVFEFFVWLVDFDWFCVCFVVGELLLEMVLLVSVVCLWLCLCDVGLWFW